MPHKSLELDAGASLFQLSLGLLGIFLLGLLEDGLRSAVDKSLGLGQAEVGDGADSLDDLDLGSSVETGEDDVELGLLLGSGSGSAGSSGRSAAPRANTAPSSTRKNMSVYSASCADR